MYKTRLGKLITLGSKIAKGGEGEVFNIVGDYSNCIKIYHENIRTSEREEKLKFMTLNPPKDVIGINHKICWPKEVVYENGNFVGFLMPRSFDDSLLPYHLCQPLIPKKLISQWHNTFDRDTIKGRSSRIKLSVNIIATVNKIHISKKYVLVDLKPQNLLVTASGKVSIIDLDSVQISENGKVLFRAPVSTPEYTPPEASELIKKNLPITQDWDVFSLGVLVYEILCGIHPYVGSASPPNENLNTIQEKIKVNLTHITKGEGAFKILPTPHKNFLRYNIEIRNIFKKIFKPYIPSESSRPELKHFGETLFNSIVQLEELQKKEAKKVKKDFEKEALENYLKLKKDNKKLNERYKTVISKLNIHITDNKNLRTKLDNKSNNFSVVWNFIIFFLLIAVSCTWIITYNISLENYNELKEEYDFSVGMYSNLLDEKNNLINKFAPIKISKITFDSYNEETEIYGYDDQLDYLPKTKTYFLYPTIYYSGKRSKRMTLNIKYIDSEGNTYESTETKGLGYTGKISEYLKKGKHNKELAFGYGNNEGSWIEEGECSVEIWWDGIMLYKQNFTITDN